MKRSILTVVVCLVGLLGAVMAAPTTTYVASSPLDKLALVSAEPAEAAISRGGGEGGGGGRASQVGSNTARLLQGVITPLIFILAAIGIGVAAFQRNAGMAVAVIVLALVVGAFTIVPNQVEGWFKEVYNFIL